MNKNEIIMDHMTESIIIKPYKHDTKYYETDQMGIIHHSNYIKWTEERYRVMENYGIEGIR